jgi:cytoskeletal protein RodZ
MKQLLRGRFGTFLMGIVLGALVFWAIGLLTHIPGENTSNTNVTTYSSIQPPSHSTGTTSSSNTDPGSSSPLPSSIPIYTPSSLMSSGTNKAVYSSQSPDYTVVNYYGEMLSKDGWKITTESTQNGATTINASGDGLAMSVSITAAGNNGSQFTIQNS